MPLPIRVLFLCTGNSARSIIAEALLRKDPAAMEGTDLVKLAAFQATVQGMRQRIAAFAEVARRFVRT